MTKSKGTCYRDAWRYQIKNGGTLVHGSLQITSEGKRVKHAWVDLGDKIWEPETGQEYPPEIFVQAFHPIVSNFYGVEEAGIKMLKANAHGPWDDPEFQRLLK